MKALKLFLLSLLICTPAMATDYVQGEALVTFRAPKGIEITEASLTSGDARAFIDGLACTVQAKVIRTYGTLSASTGDKIIALLRSDTKTTTELVKDLKANPYVLSASANHKIRIPPQPSKKGVR